jgi:ectoine hydroxylase-related dioxygenase (phytanoyl-CoA dioxygenase family)
MVKSVFIDARLNAEFDEQGYVVLEGIHSDAAKNLYKRLNALKSGVDGKFYASLWSSDKAYRRTVDAAIKEYLEPLGQKLFTNYTSLFSDLLVKKPSLFHHFEAHQDWTFVDEERYASVYMWCPLQDVTPQNGCLYVLPGSHKILDKIRGSNIPPSYESIKPALREQMIPIKLKAGELIVFNQATLHASPPNRSLKNRLAIGLLFLPTGADVFHYHYNKEKEKVEKLHADYEFFMKFSDSDSFVQALYSGSIERPDGVVAEEFSAHFSQMKLEDFNSLTASH